MSSTPDGPWYRFRLSTVFGVLTLFCVWLGMVSAISRQFANVSMPVFAIIAADPLVFLLLAYVFFLRRDWFGFWIFATMGGFGVLLFVVVALLCAFAT